MKRPAILILAVVVGLGFGLGVGYLIWLPRPGQPVPPVGPVEGVQDLKGLGVADVLLQRFTVAGAGTPMPESCPVSIAVTPGGVRPGNTVRVDFSVTGAKAGDKYPISYKAYDAGGGSVNPAQVIEGPSVWPPDGAVDGQVWFDFTVKARSGVSSLYAVRVTVDCAWCPAGEECHPVPGVFVIQP